MGLKVSIAKMFSHLTHTPNVYVVEGVTVFGCFPRFLALLQKCCIFSSVELTTMVHIFIGMTETFYRLLG